MESGLPEDLIRQVLLVTRAESGLSHYDPTQNLPPLPSISKTVASFDPSQANLRCKNCKGKLLRGVQSVVCVYCGRPNDIVLDPICFKDTVAYCWLLESLHLDGSEIVGPPLERSDSDRGQSSPNDGICLSDLLNFKIRWPTDEQNRENNTQSTELEGRSYFKFSGIDLDNFFYKSSRLDASSKPKQHQSTSNDVVNAEMSAVPTNNLSFFENVPFSEAAVHSSKGKDNNEFSGWEADFQSANSGNEFEGSESLDLNVNSVVAPRNDSEISRQTNPLSDSTFDISSHLDTVFGSVKDLSNAELQDDPEASTSVGDLTADDMWNNFDLKPSLKTNMPDPAVVGKDAIPEENTSSVDLSYQLDSLFVPKKELKDGKETPDLTSGPSTSDDLWNNLSFETSQQSEPPLTSVTNVLPQESTNSPSTSLNWFQVEPANNVVAREDTSISDWNEFTSSNPVQDFSNSAPIEDQKQSTAASGSTTELFLSNSENSLEEMEFGSFSQADPFKGLYGKDSVAELNDIAAAVSNRASEAKSDAGESLVQSDSNVDVNNVSTQTREDVETMLSQMHDLSFMLEDKLSLPPKLDGFDSFSMK